MAIRIILKEGEVPLRKRCKDVTEFDQRLHCLLDDMLETMKKANGVGLAANQIGILKKVVIAKNEDDYLEFVNPTLLSAEGEVIDAEGCLSIDSGKNDMVKRPKKVTVKAFDRFGKEFIVTREDWMARIICHELDHLDGILFIDKIYKEDDK